MNTDNLSTRQVWVELSMGNLSLDDFESWLSKAKDEAYETGFKDGQIEATQGQIQLDDSWGYGTLAGTGKHQPQPLSPQTIADILKQIGGISTTSSKQPDLFDTDLGSDSKPSTPSPHNSNGIWFQYPQTLKIEDLYVQGSDVWRTETISLDGRGADICTVCGTDDTFSLDTACPSTDWEVEKLPNGDFRIIPIK
jgi:hypothetical protein